MVVCSFYLRGQCKFGSSCRNEHPPNHQPIGGAFGSSAWNKVTSKPSTAAVVGFTAESIADDIVKEKPLWPLSSYAPSKHEINMVHGLDLSMEELRWKAFRGGAAGMPEYITTEANIISAATAVYTKVQGNISQFFEIAKQASLSGVPPDLSTLGTASSISAFGNSTSNPASTFGGGSNAVSAFGTPVTQSVFGTPSKPVSAFGTPVPATGFGTPANTTQPAFGTSGFGNTSTTTPASGFGQPSTFGKPSFGQPAFGQSAFGQPAPSNPAQGAFGQPTPATTTSGFRQPSGFDQEAAKPLVKPASGAFGAFANTGPSPFGAAAIPAANNNPNPFGQQNTQQQQQQPAAGGFAGSLANAKPSAAPTFGQPAFGQPAFGQPAGGAPTPAFGQPAPGAPVSVFGQPAAPAAQASGFGTQPAQAGPAFGQPAPAFGQPAPAAPTNPFGAQNTPSPFGQAQPTPAAPSSGFGTSQPSAPPTLPTSSSSSTTLGGKKGPDFANAKYNYRPGLIPHDGQLPRNYAELVPKETMEAFRAVRFEWGKVPVWVPPVEVRARVGEALFS